MLTFSLKLVYPALHVHTDFCGHDFVSRSQESPEEEESIFPPVLNARQRRRCFSRFGWLRYSRRLRLKVHLCFVVAVGMRKLTRIAMVIFILCMYQISEADLKEYCCHRSEEAWESSPPWHPHNSAAFTLTVVVLNSRNNVQSLATVVVILIAK